MSENPTENAKTTARRRARQWLWGLLALPLSTVLGGCTPLYPPPAEQPPAQPAAPTAPPAAPVAQPAPASPETLEALEQLTDLKEELKKLLNAVEKIEFDRETIQWRQQNLFQDFDRRILKLERDVRLLLSQPAVPANNAPASAPATTLNPDPAADDGAGASPPAVPAAPADIAIVIPVPDPGGDTTVTAPIPDPSAETAPDPSQTAPVPEQRETVSVQEQQVYDQAFSLLKQSKYQDAINVFQRLADTWPNGQLADDAHYWKSEAQYVNREYEDALDGFRMVTARYPDSPRVPEALLKIGQIEYDIGAYEEAAEIFRNILERFPDHKVAVPAQMRLRRIEQTIQ